MTARAMEAGIRDKLERVRGNVAAAAERSGRTADDVRVLVASKYYSPEQVGSLSAAGVDLVGENRAEDLVAKQDAFGGAFEWHFIGHVQRRKAKIVASRASLIHSVDSVKLIEELAKRAPGNGVEVLFQVNVSGEESKYGVSEDEVEGLLEATAATEGAVRARGFMTVAPLVGDPEAVRYVFAKLRGIRDTLRGSWNSHFDLSELSMGMSSDYEVAVEEGATVVRIGRMLIEEDGSVRRNDGS